MNRNNEPQRLRQIATDCIRLAAPFDPLHRAVLYDLSRRFERRAEAVEVLQTLREER